MTGKQPPREIRVVLEIFDNANGAWALVHHMVKFAKRRKIRGVTFGVRKEGRYAYQVVAHIPEGTRVTIHLEGGELK